MKPIGLQCDSCERKRTKLRAEESEKSKRAKERAEKKSGESQS